MPWKEKQLLLHGNRTASFRIFQKKKHKKNRIFIIYYLLWTECYVNDACLYLFNRHLSKTYKKTKMNCELMLTYDTPALQQTGSRNLMGPKTFPKIGGTYMKLVTKYQISAINSGWEKCDEKWAYMFNVYKNQQSRQTGSRNLMVQKCFPRYGVPRWSLWPNIRSLPSTVTEKSATKNILDRWTEVKQYTPLPLQGAGV